MTHRSDNYYLLSLGCAKNTVDSQSMAQLLDEAGMQGVGDPDTAEVLIVNTCGFIADARQESIDALNELAARKAGGQLLIAAGCLSQRYGSSLVQEVPGLDGVIGTRRWMDIVDLVRRLRDHRHPEPLYHLPEEAATVGADEKGAFRVARQGASAYLKIADGCRRPCAFCAIPAIKGTAVSRPVAAIVEDAARLRDSGVQEIVLIAQDLTDYGHDLGQRDGLAQLLEAMVAVVPDLPWIRLMYAYPGAVTPRLIDLMADTPQILPYLDMPLQHAHRDTLLRMRRPANVDWVYRTIGAMRDKMPHLAIRTTFIVGYPGETEDEFTALLDFVQDLQFDRVGVFTYSYEVGTPSATQANHVPDALKQERLERLMALQQSISLARNQALTGQTLDVLVEGYGEATDDEGQALDEMISVGRSYRDAPEIDGYVFIEGQLPVGEIVPVRISGAMVYDLVGTVETGDGLVITPGQVYGPGDLAGS